jgi:hypothetical protein
MTTAAQRAMAKAFLTLIGAKYSSRMVYAVIAWVMGESGRDIIGNNPWNQHHGAPCSPVALATVKVAGKLIPHSQYLMPGPDYPGLIGNRWAGPTDSNVAIYATIADGLRQSANNLLRGEHDKWTGYWYVVLAARNDDPKGFMDALARSAWAADRYGTKNGGENRLITVYRELVADLGAWYQV